MFQLLDSRNLACPWMFVNFKLTLRQLPQHTDLIVVSNALSGTVDIVKYLRLKNYSYCGSDNGNVALPIDKQWVLGNLPPTERKKILIEANRFLAAQGMLSTSDNIKYCLVIRQPK